MNFRLRRQRQLTDLVTVRHDADHHIESGFNSGLCRFVLDCSCGDHFDTPYIDEALEYRELHERLAPLADQLAG